MRRSMVLVRGLLMGATLVMLPFVFVLICDVVALVFLPQIVTFLAGLVIDRFDPDRQMPCRAS